MWTGSNVIIPVSGILRRQDAVEKRALEVVDVLRIRRSRAYSARVSRIMLCVQQVSMVFAGAEALRELALREEMFYVAVPAGGVGALFDHGSPEELAPPARIVGAGLCSAMR